MAYLGVKLKKTLAIKLYKFLCHIIQAEDKKVFHSSKVNIQFFCYIDVLHTISSAPGMANTLCELSLDICICSHTT